MVRICIQHASSTLGLPLEEKHRTPLHAAQVDTNCDDKRLARALWGEVVQLTAGPFACWFFIDFVGLK